MQRYYATQLQGVPERIVNFERIYVFYQLSTNTVGTSPDWIIDHDLRKSSTTDYKSGFLAS
jgi:hypothetical protein